MADITKSAIREIGRQVREQHRAREWCRRNPYPWGAFDLPTATVENPMTDLRQRGLARVEKTLSEE